MGAHLIDGEFQSDKYPTTPRGKVPLSIKDPTAQDLLWEYADRHQPVDAEFSTDLRAALFAAGYHPADETVTDRLTAVTAERDALRTGLIDVADRQMGRRNDLLVVVAYRDAANQLAVPFSPAEVERRAAEHNDTFIKAEKLVVEIDELKRDLAEACQIACAVGGSDDARQQRAARIAKLMERAR
jgi:hypothetical protein